MRSEHQFINSIDGEKFKRVLDTVNNIKIDRYLETSSYDDLDFKEVRDVIDAHEFAIVNLWQYAFDNSNITQKREFHKVCKNCFSLLHVLPLPSEDTEKIKHVLKLFVYAYLGEKWEDVKRFLIENKDAWKVNTDAERWDLRLLSNTYMAILYLVRKSSRDDLLQATRHIANLRKEQAEYENEFFEDVKQEDKKGTALEVVSYYHLAGAVDLLSKYMSNGRNTGSIVSKLDYHFDTAIRYCQHAAITELDLLLRMLKIAFRKMVENSIWNAAGQINPRITKFIELITADANPKPVFELLYPQRVAILEKRLLDPVLKAIVVNLPTSSGKTIMAELRILQALSQPSELNKKIVYVVPTRALVNQITARLRRDLGSSQLNIRVEKMSGAIEVDSFEENILESNTFDVLVTTPEKLNLLIRNPERREFAKSIALAIIDEAHNIANKNRGLNLEMLISNIQRDCEGVRLLLMSPFVPNHNEVARWLDPNNPQSIHIELEWWQPNDKVVGLYYAKKSENSAITHFQPLVTYSDTLELRNEVKIGILQKEKFGSNLSNLTKSKLTSFVACQLQQNQSILVLGYRITDTWSIAEQINSILPEAADVDQNRELVARYTASELGESFPLANYIRKGIGVHNAGLPDDIRELQEWLMETGSLKILVATSTISQGINFPIDGILMASYAYPYVGSMPSMEFWNLVGRAGRIDQHSLGLIGIAVEKKESNEAKAAIKYVQKNTEELVSVLKTLVEKATDLEKRLNLLAYTNEPEWSSFLQYISHMYKQSNSLQEFIAEIDINLRLTYGYNQLSQQKKNNLMHAVENYAKNLDKNKELATLSDKTGFAPETVQRTISKVNELKIEPHEWDGSKLFSGKSRILSKLTGIMLEDIPETKRELKDIKISGTQITNNTLSKLISDWVSGEEISTISAKYFEGIDTKAMSRCVKAIYSKVTSSATWGLAALQKLPTSGIKLEELSEEEKRKLVNLPAMVFYGVNTDEAILMRLNNIPRSISKNMGKQFRIENPEFYKVNSSDVVNWIKNLDVEKWDSMVPQNKKLSGGEYKKIWERISGL